MAERKNPFKASTVHAPELDGWLSLQSELCYNEPIVAPFWISRLPVSNELLTGSSSTVVYFSSPRQQLPRNAPAWSIAFLKYGFTNCDLTCGQHWPNRWFFVASSCPILLSCIGLPYESWPATASLNLWRPTFTPSRPSCANHFTPRMIVQGRTLKLSGNALNRYATRCESRREADHSTWQAEAQGWQVAEMAQPPACGQYSMVPKWTSRSQETTLRTQRCLKTREFRYEGKFHSLMLSNCECS